MTAYPIKPHNPPPFRAQKDTLLARIKKYSVNDLMKLYAVKEPLALENKQRFEHFDEGHLAYHAYTGYMFKMMDKASLNVEAQTYIKEHLLIVSGLYGLVGMDHTIGLYRLPMGVTLHQPLSNYWQDTLTEYLKDEWVVDLLSQEYRDAFDVTKLNFTTIDFVMDQNGKEHRPAMALKKARGLMVREMALNHVQDQEALKTLVVDGYRYDAKASTDTLYVFKKD